MRFKKFNMNPLGKKVSDCSIRAISKALGKSWLEVFDGLHFFARKMFHTQSDINTIKEYLKDYETSFCNAIKGKKRLAVKDFNKGTYILRTANHITCVIDNVNYDLWDNRERCVYRYWKIE